MKWGSFCSNSFIAYTAGCMCFTHRATKDDERLAVSIISRYSINVFGSTAHDISNEQIFEQPKNIHTYSKSSRFLAHKSILALL